MNINEAYAVTRYRISIRHRLGMLTWRAAPFIASVVLCLGMVKAAQILEFIKGLL